LDINASKSFPPRACWLLADFFGADVFDARPAAGAGAEVAVLGSVKSRLGKLGLQPGRRARAPRARL
jgi:hypothetical protein